MRRTAAQIRQEFIDYFCQRAGHTFVPSSPVVPHDDPTLLFTNAGMNQFKDVFLGAGTRPYTRAVNTQKCIRAGGKHNDLEDVGKDTYHHTFFEMLGNWSFGDYFKAEAIEWGWELLTMIWGLDPRRLHATYFEGDAAESLAPDLEARDLWLRYLPKERVHPGNKKDNFWEMGETGPCGPCSEIHFDGTEEGVGGPLVNTGDPRVIEIWNLVFIQFNRAPSTIPGQPGALTALPAKHVDTGMGFERIVRVLQGKHSNYDTDIWSPIFSAIEQHTGAHAYRGRLNDPIDVAYRVIADHIRCLSVAITDGARPSNEGRGYVLRRILRRAVRHAHQTLGVKGPLLHMLVPSVVESLGNAFPELSTKMNSVEPIIREEEEAFLKTLDRGIELFNDAAQRATNKTIAADDAFQLHDTFGFPIDLTRVMAEERGMNVDEAGFNALMEQARERSRGQAGATAGGTAAVNLTLGPDAIARLKRLNIDPTDDIDKYHARPISTVVKAIWLGTDFDDEINDPTHDDLRAIITQQTNFYADSGGQIADTGTIVDVDRDASQFEVVDVKSFGGYVLHIGRLRQGHIRVGEQVQMLVEGARRAAIRANHTATHLLNHALRTVVGEEVHQRGSLVAVDRLRFDYSHGHALTHAQLELVGDHVNGAIERSMPVYAETVNLHDARRIRGVRAIFGERYPDPVRVVSIGVPVADLMQDPQRRDWMDYSIEFCGGTHLASTDEARRCIIIAEQALAAGVRRILALTGPAALAAEEAGRQLFARATNAVKLADDLFLAEYDDLTRLVDELTIPAATKHRVVTQLESLRQRAKSLRKTAESAARGHVVEQAHEIVQQANGPIIVSRVHGADQSGLLAAMDVVRAKRPDAAAMLLSANVIESKVFIVASVPKPIITQGLKAGDWVKKAALICGGSGGGRPDMAQAGGKDPTQVDKAIAEARAYASGLLKA
jgi:alanyl-tRNA synthetase